MKKILFFVTATLLLTTGCNDYLNTVPFSNTTADNFYKTANDAELAITGCYNRLVGGSAYTLFGSGIQSLLDSGTDECVLREGLSEPTFGQFPLGTYPEDHLMFSAAWHTLYNSINRTNYLLEKIEDIDMSLTRKTEIKGEAHFLRGFFYFYLGVLYGGAPVYTTSYQDPEAPRNSLQEVFLQAIEDLTFASESLPDRAGITGRANKWTASGYLVKTYCYLAACKKNNVGTNFAKNGNKVFFGDVPGEITRENQYTIVTKIPYGTPDGVINLYVEKEGVRSLPFEFEVGLIFSDDFNRSSTAWVDKSASDILGKGWEIIGGQFRIDNQLLYSEEGKILCKLDSAVTENDMGHSFRLGIDFRIDVAAGTCFAGLIFNAQDADNWYVLRVGGAGGLVQFLATNNGGMGWSGVMFNKSGYAFQGGNTFYRLTVFSDTPGAFDVKITSLDTGETVFDERVTDSAVRFTGGVAGIFSLETHTQFDNFTLSVK
ncbi:MAG: RagB/SusD family nutrient uptake outer membrane protein [Dysgonamonadaceae bacterium]|nr:RagB/SusD family nutrient uptake outer membrane protein [Dysgonamonadaceae bacterium]